MRVFLFYAVGYIFGYCVAVWQTNNKWIWASNAPNLRQICRKENSLLKMKVLIIVM